MCSSLASVITILVGTGKARETFVLHEALLRQNSDFFENALKREWKEAEERTVKLPEIEPRQFAVFAKFLLTGLVFIRPGGDILKMRENKTEKDRRSSFASSFRSFMEMLTLARFLQSSHYQDAALDILIESLDEYRRLSKATRTFFSGTHIMEMHGVTALDSCIRNFLVDLNLHGWAYEFPKDAALESCPAHFCQQFIRKALPYMYSNESLLEVPDPVDVTNSCKYHEHTKRGEPCYKEKLKYLPITTNAATGMSAPPFSHLSMLNSYRRRSPYHRYLRMTRSPKSYPNTTPSTNATQRGDAQAK